ncbi:MAG: hypothetical protein HPM95_12665 [Alphaproteobacteria bacterium]|nr:hypothetical protein [Alphaproteobacteria bacterium]
MSNFTAALVREAQDLAGGALSINQVEYHPQLSRRPCAMRLTPPEWA